MLKTYLVLMVGLCFEAFGNVMLRKGMKEIGEVKDFSIPALFEVFVKGVTNLTVVTGVALDALFFASLLIALSWAEVTVVLPLTAFGYVMQAFVAMVVLHEDMSLMRWAGTLAIVAGCILIGKSGMH